MKYGLIGEKLGHSFSKAIHNALGNSNYEICPLPPEKLDFFLQNRDFLGINVTIPYKKTVMPYCLQLSEGAKKIGSVNTIINNDGALYGHNTDYDGFLFMARRAGISFLNKHVLILGSGGTALTAACVANAEGAADTCTVSRGGTLNYSNVYEHWNAQIIINTTPCGMFPDIDASPIDLGLFPNLCGVIDVIYNPISTSLIQQARELDIPATCGLPMLVAQAAHAHRLFFGIGVTDARIEEIISAMECRFSNIVLIGMPGSGKTSIGKAVAAALSRPFFDTDECISQNAGQSISDIFASQGEERFRQLEGLAIAALAGHSGAVIATGGGAVLSPQNRRLLARNGYVIFIERPLECLAQDGRPLSAGLPALQKIYAHRFPIYSEMCRLSLANDGDISVPTQKIIELFGGAL